MTTHTAQEIRGSVPCCRGQAQRPTAAGVHKCPTPLDFSRTSTRSLDTKCCSKFRAAIRKAIVCSDSNRRARRKMSICNSLRSSSGFEKWPKAPLPICSEMVLIHHCNQRRCPSLTGDISTAASILNGGIRNFSRSQIIFSLRNLNYKQQQLKADQTRLQRRFTT